MISLITVSPDNRTPWYCSGWDLTVITPFSDRMRSAGVPEYLIEITSKAGAAESALSVWALLLATELSKSRTAAMPEAAVVLAPFIV
jgi:hypothetical protein